MNKHRPATRPQPTTITATQMHQQRGAIIRRCFRDKEHFIVEKDGMPLVALIPIDLYLRLSRATSATPYSD